MQESSMPQVALKDRLSLYRLEAPEALDDLAVGDHQRLALTATSRRFHHHFRTMRPDSFHELKQWIGVPQGSRGLERSPTDNHQDFVATANRFRFTPTPRLALGNQELETTFTWALVNDIANPTAPGREVSQFAHLVSSMALVLGIFQDIYVGVNATLVCDKTVHVLFARHITLDHGARIEMQAPVTRIDCQGIVAYRPGVSSTVNLQGQQRSISHG